MSKPFDSYDAFAWFYKKYWASVFVEKGMKIVERFIIPKLNGGPILDLCCGSGALAHALAAKGHSVVGVDGSAALLKYAEGKGDALEFVHDDARTFRRPNYFNGAIAAFDSLNHILEEDQLVRVFENVFSSLKGDSTFVFDLNMEDGFITRWNNTFSINQSDHLAVITTAYDQTTKLAKFDVTMFLKDNGGVWKRTDVSLPQKAYPETSLVKHLESAGFSSVKVVDSEELFPDWKQPGRKFFVSEKL